MSLQEVKGTRGAITRAQVTQERHHVVLMRKEANVNRPDLFQTAAEAFPRAVVVASDGLLSRIVLPERNQRL